MDQTERQRLLSAYEAHSVAFEWTARRRHRPGSNIHLVPPVPTEATTLTTRELEVLTLVAEGLTDIEIGSRLFIAAFTVKSHIKKLLRKLGARSRAHAVAVGFRRGFIS